MAKTVPVNSRKHIFQGLSKKASQELWNLVHAFAMAFLDPGLSESGGIAGGTEPRTEGFISLSKGDTGLASSQARTDSSRWVCVLLVGLWVCLGALHVALGSVI